MGICIGVIIFTLCINFVGTLGVFPIGSDAGTPMGTSTNETLNSITSGYDITDFLNIITVGGSILTIGGALFLLYVTQSTIILGAYLFTTVFWGSYGLAVGRLLAMDLFVGPIVAFATIFTVIIALIFLAAITGMLSGNG
jgi:hypothetical protein